MNRLLAVIKKEFAHIFRDPTSLAIVLIMPVLMLFLYGHALSFDLKNINLGVIDYSKSKLSQKLVKKFSHNNYYKVILLKNQYQNPLQKGEEFLKSGKLKEVMVIPADFSRSILSGKKSEIGFIIDGSDSNVANLLVQYNDRIILDFLYQLQKGNTPFKINTKIYFNPELKSSFFFIPGLIAILLMMISALLTSLSITREKESGSIDLMFISPLRSGEIIIGKVIPYIVVSLAVGAIILLVASFWFQIPFRGSLLVLLGFSLLYVVCGLSFGILASTVASSQKTAMFIALLGTLLPSILLSGFIFPLDSLSPVIKGISYLVPATYFLKIIRGIILRGAEFKHFFIEGIVMIVFSVFLTVLSIKKFNHNRKNIK